MKGWFASGYLLAAFLLLPFVVLVVGAFTLDARGWEHSLNTVLFDYTYTTLCLVLGVVVLSTLLAVLPAWWLAMYDMPHKTWLHILLMLPLSFPAYISAFVYIELFEYGGMFSVPLKRFMGDASIRSLIGAVVVISSVLYPYVYILMYLSFRRMRGLVYSTCVFGKSLSHCFFSIGLRLSRPALVAGSALVAMESLADFGVVQYFAVDTLTTGIYRSWFGQSDYGMAVHMSLLLLCVVFVVLFIEKYGRKDNRYSYDDMAHTALLKPRKLHLCLMLVLCLLLPFIGWFIPLLQLVLWGVDSYHKVSFFHMGVNSVIVAAMAACIAVVVAMFFVFLLRRQMRMGAVVRSVMLGYAVPGSVAAVACMIGLGWIQKQWGLPIIQTGIAALVFVYVFRFLAVAFHAIESGAKTLPGRFDDMLDVYKIRPSLQLYSVYMPMLKPSIIVAGLLVFVESVKELPATLMIRPFNFETLATYTYQLAMDEQYSLAALPALVIIALATVSVILLVGRLTHEGRS